MSALVSFLLLSAVCAVAFAGLAVWDLFVSPRLQRRADVRWARRHPDVPIPFLVERVR